MTPTEARAIELVCRHFGPLSAVREDALGPQLVLVRGQGADIVQLPARGIPGARYDQKGRRTR